jgi:hypothetical protein
VKLSRDAGFWLVTIGVTIVLALITWFVAK